MQARLLRRTFLAALIALVTALQAEETDGTSELDVLLHQLDEERMAYQLYVAFGRLYPNLRQFQNIPRAEARHYGALAAYARANYPEVEIGEVTDSFEFPATAELHAKLLAEGNAGPKAALGVGKQVEEIDIRDLDAGLASVENSELKTIYAHLRRGSERHLAAFNRGLAGGGKGGHGMRAGHGAGYGHGKAGGAKEKGKHAGGRDGAGGKVRGSREACGGETSCVCG